MWLPTIASMVIYSSWPASYVAALADASLQDNQLDPALFAFLQKTQELMNDGLDRSADQYLFETRFCHVFEFR